MLRMGYYLKIKKTNLSLVSSDTKNLDSEELKRREHYQRALLDNFPFMVWLKDKESRFLANNSIFAQVAGVKDVKELEGKTDFDFFPEDLAKSLC